MRLFNELRRRNVFKVGTAYLVVAWLVLQVADVTLGNFDAPGWVFKSIFVALAVGLPIVVLLSWVYELTPGGLERDAGGDGDNDSTTKSIPVWPVIIATLLIGTGAYLAADFFYIDGEIENSLLLEKSIAVLPFRNRSDRAEDDNFVDGIHDDILTQLGRLSTFEKVISRTSMEQYRNTEKSMPQIGEELGVSSILEGGVQRAGDRVRINVQLIDAATDKQVWADTYDRELTIGNLFSIQSDITREVVGELQLALSVEDSERINFIPTVSLQAYDEFTLGRKQIDRRTAESLANAERHFKRAIEIDPDFSLAYTGLAETLSLLPDHAGVPWQETIEPRRAAIERALELDPLSGEAYNTLALATMNNLRMDSFERSSVEVDRLFEKAIELVPNYPLARTWYGFYLGSSGRGEKAIPHMRKAVELDPEAPVHRHILATNLIAVGRIEEAQEVLRSGIARNPDFHGYYRTMAGILRQQGSLGNAQRWTNQGVRLNAAGIGVRRDQCFGYAQLHSFDASEQCYDQLESDFPDNARARYARLYLHWVRGDTGSLFEMTERLEAESELNSNVELFGELLLIYGIVAQLEKAGPLLRRVEPKLFGEGPVEIIPVVIPRYVLAAIVMQSDGQHERASYLLNELQESMRSMHRTRGVGYGVMDVTVYVLKGERQKAIAALREAIDDGWRLSYWLKLSYFDAMKDDPEWRAMLEEIDKKVEVERLWYEEHRDEPLF